VGNYIFTVIDLMDLNNEQEIFVYPDLVASIPILDCEF